MRPRLVPRVVKTLRNRIRELVLRARGMRLRGLAILGCMKLGRRLRLGRHVDVVLYGDLIIGDDVYIDDGAKLQVGPGARLLIGDGAYVGRGMVIAATQSIRIGARTLMGEHGSIRDADHHVDPLARRNERDVPRTPIDIEEDVWIAAGVRILRGSVIGEGSTIAANSVVKGRLPPRTIAAGAPARIVKELAAPGAAAGHPRLGAPHTPPISAARS